MTGTKFWKLILVSKANNGIGISYGGTLIVIPNINVHTYGYW